MTVWLGSAPSAGCVARDLAQHRAVLCTRPPDCRHPHCDAQLCETRPLKDPA